MTTAIDWGTKVLTVPKADLTFVSGTLYELDTEAWRLEVKALETSEDGQPELDIHKHTTETTIAGVAYARFIELINGYTVTFEDGQYAVKLVGSNNNIFDEGVINRNQVSIIPTNSAGLIRSGEDIAAEVWAYAITPNFSVADLVRGIAAANLAKLSGAAGTTVIIRDVDDTKDAITATVDASGNRISVTLDLT